MKFGVGQALTRKEDDPLIRGAGHYVADLAPADAGHAVVLRSPHAHARFRMTDLRRAREMPGIRTILTFEDIADLGSRARLDSFGISVLEQALQAPCGGKTGSTMKETVTVN